MKKIAIIVDEIAEKNSNERFILFTLEDLYKKGFQVFVYASKFSENFPAYIVKKKTNIADGMFNAKNTARHLSKEILSYDIVIAYNYPAALILAMIKEIYIDKKIKPPRMISYMYNMPSSLYGYSYENISNINQVLEKKIISYKSMAIKKDILYSDIIDINICSSKSCKKFASMIYEKEFQILYPGVSASFVEYRKTLEKGNYFLILNHLYEKNAMAENNIENVVLSFYNFIKSNTNTDMRLKITGSNISHIKKQAIFLDIANKIDFIGIPNTNDTSLLMAGANVILNTVSKEPFSISIFEAWVYKAAPIIDITSAASEIAEDKVNAIVVDSSNPISLTKAMNYFANKNNAEKLAENGKRKLHEEFSISKHTDKLLEIASIAEHDSLHTNID